MRSLIDDAEHHFRLAHDTLFIEVEMLQRKRQIAKCRGRCIVNSEVVSEAEMMFGIVDK